jgi:hypothetical protein
MNKTVKENITFFSIVVIGYSFWLMIDGTQLIFNKSLVRCFSFLALATYLQKVIASGQ